MIYAKYNLITNMILDVVGIILEYSSSETYGTHFPQNAKTGAPSPRHQPRRMWSRRPRWRPAVPMRRPRVPLRKSYLPGGSAPLPSPSHSNHPIPHLPFPCPHSPPPQGKILLINNDVDVLLINNDIDVFLNIFTYYLLSVSDWNGSWSEMNPGRKMVTNVFPSYNISGYV